MFRGLLLALSLFAFATPAAAWQNNPTEIATAMSNSLQPMVGQTFEGGIMIAAVSSEGPTLVVRVGGPAGWRTGFTPQTISDAFKPGFCKEAASLFSLGISLRVDSVDSGSILQGPLITSCT